LYMHSVSSSNIPKTVQISFEFNKLSTNVYPGHTFPLHDY